MRAVIATIVLCACAGPVADPAPPVPSGPAPSGAPVVAAVVPGSPPRRAIPRDEVVRVPAGEERSVAGTDVVIAVAAVEAPSERGGRARVSVRTGSAAAGSVVDCGVPATLAGVVVEVACDSLAVGAPVSFEVAAIDGTEPFPECAGDADCVASTFACCHALCAPVAVHADRLAADAERCARRVCPAAPDAPCADAEPVARAACLAGRCALVP